MSLHEILVHPLTALFFTLGSFLVAQKIQKALGGHSLLNPVVMAIALVVIYIYALGIPYEEYLQNVNLIHGLLGPATVALALPLYKQLQQIKNSAFGIVGAVFISSLVAGGVAYFLADFMGAAENIQLSIIPKSATTPIAIGIAEKIGTEPALAVFFVFTTGIIGSLIATTVFNIFRIKDEVAIGLALGTTCHGLGVARALQYSEKAGAFAALGMSLMGIISGIILPILVINFLL